MFSRCEVHGHDAIRGAWPGPRLEGPVDGLTGGDQLPMGAPVEAELIGFAGFFLPHQQPLLRAERGKQVQDGQGPTNGF